MADTLMAEIMAEPMLPVAGGALGLLVLGGAGIAMRRRRRRREDKEFEARQQALARIEDKPILELDQAAEVRPEPAVVRAAAPVHDPVPERTAPIANPPGDQSHFGRQVQAVYRGPSPAKGTWKSRSDTDFLIRRAGKDAKHPAEQD